MVRRTLAYVLARCEDARCLATRQIKPGDGDALAPFCQDCGSAMYPERMVRMTDDEQRASEEESGG